MRALRFVLFALAAVTAGALVYYTIAVIQARRATPGIVENVRASGAMVLDLEDFPEGWLADLLAVEDPAFHEHNGMDLSTPGAGITTITQGMVKYFYFERFEPGIAKLEQTLIAVLALDALVPKDVQLALFVNTVYLGQHEGRPVRGFAGAARAYFGKSFHELHHDEYLALVAMIIAPATYHVKQQPAANARRVARIRQLLAGAYRPTGLMDLYYGEDAEVE